MNLLYNSEFVPSTAVMIGVKSTIFGPVVDTHDCDAVMFMVAGNTEFGPYGTSGALHVQCSTYSSGGFANYGSTKAVYSTEAANGAHRVWALDVVKPTFRYLRPAVYHTTGDFQFVALKYNMRKPGSTSYRDSTAIKLGINVSSS